MSGDVALSFTFVDGTGLVRPWRRSDRDSLLRHADNVNVSRHLSLRFPYPYRPSDADAFFAMLESQADPEAWAIEVEGEAVGGIGVRRGMAEFAHSGELGYWLGEAFWRRGIVGAAVRVAVPFAMARWNLARLTAYADVRNVGSIRVLEGAGFIREGVVRARAIRAGEVHDHVAFGRVDFARLPKPA